MMKRRTFCRLTATGIGGKLVLPQFLSAAAHQYNHFNQADEVLVFIQLNGGNDGLNTLIPYHDDLYYHLRPTIGISKHQIIDYGSRLGWHPALKNLADIAQAGHLSVVQNVGYPNPNKSHFRSQEIWQTASDSEAYLASGWLGRFLEIQCRDIVPPAVNVDSIDNLALKAPEINSFTIKDFNRFKNFSAPDTAYQLSDNPQLDFVRKLAFASLEGADEIEKALNQAQRFNVRYANNPLAKNLQWIAKLIKGGLHSKIYYTSLNGFDTHNNQLQLHNKQLGILNDAVYSFYNDLKDNNLLHRVTTVIFSEFGRRVQENGSGTDHGTAAPLFVMGGNNKGALIGSQPNLGRLDNGDLIHEIDFRSVYAALLNSKFDFNPKLINIQQSALHGLF